jgi:hypothetical protein
MGGRVLMIAGAKWKGEHALEHNDPTTADRLDRR